MDEEKVTFDGKKYKQNAVSLIKRYGMILLILIPIILAVWIRMTSASLPAIDSWGTQVVNNYYISNIINQQRQNYPNLPDTQMNDLAQQQFATYYSQNKALIDNQIVQEIDLLKSAYKDSNGYVYMPDIDPYDWLRYAQNYLNHGYTADIITTNGTPMDTHSIAPIGIQVEKYNPQGVALAYLYKLNSIFNSKITLMQSSTFFPIIIIVLSLIPIFFIGKMLAGNVGGLFSATLFGINLPLLTRTSWGHADTDAWSIFFPLYAVWFFLLAIRANNTKQRVFYSILSGLSIGLFSIFWSGWWYIFDFMIGATGLWLLYTIIIENKCSWIRIKEDINIKNFSYVTLIFITICGILVSIITSFSIFISSVVQPIVFSNIKVASLTTYWPNVYTTVAELNGSTFGNTINSIGGVLFFCAAILGIILLYVEQNRYKNSNKFIAILCTLWTIGIIYASIQGVRFTMMLSIPIALSIGIAMGLVYTKAVFYLGKLEIPKIVTSIIFIILFSAMVIPQAIAGHQALIGDMPIMNSAWYTILTDIKAKSQPNAIINSWWDFGHIFKYTADRAVTFDGATQNTPMAYWIGKTLLTNNQDQAIGILRMLDCGSNNAFNDLNAYENDVSNSIDILNRIISLNEIQAKQYLKDIDIPDNIINKVISDIYCNPPEDYFITSQDMVGKAGVWAHFGSWNFNKADAWLEGKSMTNNEFTKRFSAQMNISKTAATSMYTEMQQISSEPDANIWIAPWPSYSNSYSCTNQNNVLTCGGVTIHLDTKVTTIQSQKGVVSPTAFVYVTNNTFYKKEFTENIVPTSVLLIQNGDNYIILLSSPELADSMFTRLFFYNGIGLNKFSKFSEQAQPDREDIIVWKVNW